jgi:hypothetical protein
VLCHPACPGVPWERTRISYYTRPSPLSSRAQLRDLQFRGPFLEMFSKPQNRMRLIRLLQSLDLCLIETDSERLDRLIQVLHLAGADDR